MSLFGDLHEEAKAPKKAIATVPLAERMRPRTLAEYLGQDQVVGEGRALRAAIEGGKAGSLLLWGPPGTGKTTLAQLIAQHAGLHFEPFSAVLSGVAQVQVLGAQKYAVRVQMDPYKLASRQIGVNEIENALRNWNVNLPTGAINGPQRAFTLQASGQLMNAEAYKPVIVTYRKNSPVRLEELANITDGVEDDKTASWFYNKQGSERAIILSIQRQPGTNTVAVTDSIKELIPSFKQELPPSVKITLGAPPARSARSAGRSAYSACANPAARTASRTLTWLS